MELRRPIVRIIFVWMISGISFCHAEDGYRLWLRYDLLPEHLRSQSVARIDSVVVPGNSKTLEIVKEELIAATNGLLGKSVQAESENKDNAVLAGTPKSSAAIDNLGWAAELGALGPDGYRIASVQIDGKNTIVIASQSDVGVLYGTYHLIRLLQTASRLDNLNIAQRPQFKFRLLNHWDNLNGSIERGYAGRSLWNWEELPDKIDDRLADYARANASIGINASVLTNVNANARVLKQEYLEKVTAIADVFRPYGVRVFLTARFSAPIEIGGLKTADPLDAGVKDWWKQKADEIYAIIPDFGGFLVKANSEGQPGPKTYDRSHKDGANMLAAALAPHGGIVMWRAFVYDAQPGYDRAGAAYAEFKPFDGQFADNVLIQVKNGPIDFQPREPFNALFGGLEKTQIMPELQITQEYLGQSNSICYLGTMWQEFLSADTFARGPGSTVAQTVDGSLFDQNITAIAGVANTGTDRDWCGHIFSQANWYAFGRLAWNAELDARAIAEEWTAMTFTHDRPAANKIIRLLLESREALVDVMDPLGLTHIFSSRGHYGPGPWEDSLSREDWNPTYYHKANQDAIGFDRTASGSNSISQYHEPLRKKWADPTTCPPELLLWFQHLSWDWVIPATERTLWDELAQRYQRGADWAQEAKAIWTECQSAIDAERHAMVLKELELQIRDANLWRDACLAYFHEISQRPYPPTVEKPAKTLDEYKRTFVRHER